MSTTDLTTQSIALRGRGIADRRPLEASEVTVSRHGDVFASGNHTPRGEAGPEAAASDPVPVTGYAEDLDELEGLAQTDFAVEERGDGRFAGPETVHGPDGRVRANNTTGWPWRVQGHLVITFPNGGRFIGSGTMVNRHHVLTAGHCLYSKADGGWATSVGFEAARNDGTRPFGTVYASRLLSVTGWTQGNDRNYDMGMLVLQTDLGDRTGWFGILTGPDPLLSNYRVNVSGYPGDKGGLQLWTMADVVQSVGSERIGYQLDTFGGQSGSGVWSTWKGHVGEKVVAIHTTGSSSTNGATRLSKPKFDRIIDWMTHY